MSAIFNFVIFSVFLAPDIKGINVNIASELKSDQVERTRCGYHFIQLWSAEVAHSPFVAAPLLTDVDADGSLDIVAAPVSETLTVLQADTGKPLPGTRWPAQKLDSSINSSPLQFDIDGDGLLDILFITTSGEILPFTPSGSYIAAKHLELKPAYVLQDWYQGTISASITDVQKYVVAANSNMDKEKQYVPVDPHVMASPVIVDLNHDLRPEEMVIPVSYFYNKDDYRLPENFEQISNLSTSDLDKYLVAGLTIVNLTSLEIIKTIFLDLTTRSSSFPAYALFSPTVIDIDGDGSEMEIVIGTSAGSLHVIDTAGKQKPGFPVLKNTFHGQVTVADINKDSKLELITVDTSGNVQCYNSDGTLYWEAEVSGSSSPGSRLLDVNGDSYMDVVLTTNNGDVYALNGINGSVLPNWPVKTGHPINSNILASKISSKTKTLDLVFLSDDGTLHIMSADQSCKTQYSIGEKSLVQILSHELMSLSEGLEILIATSDGTLICMGSGQEPENKFFDEEDNKIRLSLTLPSETKSPNDFVFSKAKPGIYVNQISRSQQEVIGSTFIIEFEILDPHPLRDWRIANKYTVSVYFGRHLLYSAQYDQPGEYALTVPAWQSPQHGHVVLMMTNQYGQIFKDMYPLRFNQNILEDLQWLLLAPFAAMVIILLVNHGFPAKDLLPFTFQSKNR
ncbi:hypothetical protein CHS0354_042629 [Potamilus streckersoni]|uniref:DEX1 C-terminal domain-containing protein n=1 Tax=Potamilus streckersoni TaxID=2493646 RepID=A0AAE0TDY5_9BIVA|nr:hypothetical protein CHS0354_042629 [Potamilus streckersoni]